MSSLLDRWSLQYRITAGVGCGLAAILALFGYIAFWSIGQSTDQAIRERQRLTILMAHHVSSALATVPPDDTERIEAAVRPLLDLPSSLEGGRLQVEILDGSGALVAASEPRPSYGNGSGGGHAALLADLIASGQPGVRPHQPPNNAPAHVVAYAPLILPDGRSWGLTVEQRQDALLALPRRMRQRMLLIGGVALAIASSLAWLDARRVVGPLRRVTLAAQRIAAGDLSAPLTDGHAPRGDELGQLTVALDTMRRHLVQSLAEISGWNEELERRVRQRTQELATAGEQRRQLLRKVILAQEEERKRLARELHDDTVQTLSGLAMTLQAVEDALPPALERQRAPLAWARERAVHAAREIRQLILGLRPSALDDLGLIAAVRWYAATVLEPVGITMQLEAQDADGMLPPLVQTAAFRVLQEALANAARHAAARHVTIRISATAHALVAAVEDDGCGFDPGAPHLAGDAPGGTGQGLGLLGMRERVALLGGQLTLRSQPGAGTTVAFTIPLDGAGAPLELAEVAA